MSDSCTVENQFNGNGGKHEQIVLLIGDVSACRVGG